VLGGFGRWGCRSRSILSLDSAAGAGYVAIVGRLACNASIGFISHNPLYRIPPGGRKSSGEGRRLDAAVSVM